MRKVSLFQWEGWVRVHKTVVKVESALLHSRKSALINSLKSALAHFPVERALKETLWTPACKMVQPLSRCIWYLKHQGINFKIMISIKSRASLLEWSRIQCWTFFLFLQNTQKKSVKWLCLNSSVFWRLVFEHTCHETLCKDWKVVLVQNGLKDLIVATKAL